MILANIGEMLDNSLPVMVDFTALVIPCDAVGLCPGRIAHPGVLIFSKAKNYCRKLTWYGGSRANGLQTKAMINTVIGAFIYIHISNMSGIIILMYANHAESSCDHDVQCR